MVDLTCPTGTKLISGPTKVDRENKVAPFCIDETEVTQEAFKQYCGADKCQSKYEPGQVHRESAFATGIDWYNGRDRFYGPKLPAIYVEWQEARDYCKAKGGDLPTGEQWEKAARGPQGKRYATKSGDELSLLEANYWHVGVAGWYSYEGNSPVDVASYPSNDYGLYDMTGNVWEWTLDECAFGTRCVRGGSWLNQYKYAWLYLRASSDSSVNSTFSNNNLGFRCVMPTE